MLRLCIRGDYVIKLIQAYKIPIIGIVCLTIALLVGLITESDTSELAFKEMEEQMIVTESVPLPNTPEPIETLTTVPVYICGAVACEGVYYVREDAILETALNEAGGVIPDADATQLNLARVIVPNERIYVPLKGEVQQLIQTQQSDVQSSGLININTADATRLSDLPGIGEAKAQAIITYREINGNFETKQGIQDVPGIGEKTYQTIKAMIEVE